MMAEFAFSVVEVMIVDVVVASHSVDVVVRLMQVLKQRPQLKQQTVKC